MIHNFNLDIHQSGRSKCPLAFAPAPTPLWNTFDSSSRLQFKESHMSVLLLICSTKHCKKIHYILNRKHLGMNTLA
jgi:hypothetical protein